MERIESRGLVLYNRNFREDDKLVKIFTEKVGKRMFFVRHASQSKLSSVIQPLTVAVFILKINDERLSYIEDYQHVDMFKTINADIFKLSYASYLVALADASINDNIYDPALYAFLHKTLELINQGLDEDWSSDVDRKSVV